LPFLRTVRIVVPCHCGISLIQNVLNDSRKTI
jgi:hypothetical protein